jgi:hypothetical protein
MNRWPVHLDPALNPARYLNPHLGRSRSIGAPSAGCIPGALLASLRLRASALKIACAKNPTKISPKSDRFHESDFFNAVTSTTYNFNAVKWSDFRDRHAPMLTFWTLVLHWCLGFEVWDFTLSFPSLS